MSAETGWYFAQNGQSVGPMYMTLGIKMETVFGAPSQQQQGFFGKLVTADLVR